MNVKVVHIDINVSQHDYGVLTLNIANGNKLSVDCKKKYVLLYIVLVCVAIFAAECILQCTESCIDTRTEQILRAGFFCD
jgi:hypothetical protein